MIIFQLFFFEFTLKFQNCFGSFLRSLQERWPCWSSLGRKGEKILHYHQIVGAQRTQLVRMWLLAVGTNTVVTQHAVKELEDITPNLVNNYAQRQITLLLLIFHAGKSH